MWHMAAFRRPKVVVSYRLTLPSLDVVIDDPASEGKEFRDKTKLRMIEMTPIQIKLTLDTTDML